MEYVRLYIMMVVIYGYLEKESDKILEFQMKIMSLSFANVLQNRCS